MDFQNLQELLDTTISFQTQSVIRFVVGAAGNPALEHAITYQELRQMALARASFLFDKTDFATDSVVVLYLDQHIDNIIWFWATILAGATPCPCPTLSRNEGQRAKQILHLRHLLKEPIFLTSQKLRAHFNDGNNANTKLVSIQEFADRATRSFERSQEGRFTKSPCLEDIAILVLTSGSSGKSKAVALTNRQIRAAVKGKPRDRSFGPGSTFLNWIGFDHVANITEIHLHAMYMGANQIHVNAADVVASPLVFLRLMSRYRVARSFAPHFLLAKLLEELEGLESDKEHFDLSSLRVLTTGGEANLVSTGARLSPYLVQFGTPPNVIVPGFGMSETCAGAIYNHNFPEYDLTLGSEFASLGQCVTGIQMRVTAEWDSTGRIAATPLSPGELEVSGDIVFGEYFNNPAETAAAFTPDGWFKTGDQAMMDTNGNLCLVGRSKDAININGVKYSPHEVESAIEAARLHDIQPTYLACFHYRRNGMQSESICVVYAPAYSQDDQSARFETNTGIKQAVMLETGTVPKVIPLNQAVMQKSTLGKLSRAQLKASFENGGFHDFEKLNDHSMNSWHQQLLVPPSTATETKLVQVFASVLNLSPASLSVQRPMFDMGLDSVSLIKLKRQLETTFNLKTVSIMMLLKHPTLRALSEVIDGKRLTEGNAKEPSSYNPVVVLRTQGTKTPLWLFHPGVGEVLVFFNLTRYISDRPVYALRARGFEHGEQPFESIEEAVETYETAIQRVQANGPYALAGYSYGAMLAFETAKKLEARSEQVKFLGSFNLPPHIKQRMQELVWSECLLHLGYFLGLITESYSREVAQEVSLLTKTEALDFVFAASDALRIEELGLTKAGFLNWANVAYGLQSMAREYEPSCQVSCIDVFCAIPLAVVAENKDIWRAKHLNKWADFCASTMRMHDVDGSHYTMISQEHVFSFQKKLRAALRRRGL
ncbi:putative non-ribosomal peptide synthase-like protein [Polyplosphaeria fusca]|uniref:Non-ribosomal peptide synthase-like protein n=1 Tax=Polyplosphaeria fusca TaxID=682080 RepID=A0A9P4QM01_9PLEO|nr:putative non-ribosomal peptide synthase-like protein [Polyplosphaeria fusca]